MLRYKLSDAGFINDIYICLYKIIKIGEMIDTPSCDISPDNFPLQGRPVWKENEFAQQVKSFVPLLKLSYRQVFLDNGQMIPMEESAVQTLKAGDYVKYDVSVDEFIKIDPDTFSNNPRLELVSND